MKMCLGIDPSSRKMAVVYSIVGKENNVKFEIIKLPISKPESCFMAFEWIKKLIESLPLEPADIYVFVEAPVMGRGGIGGTLPQAQVGGALLAGAYSTGATVNLVHNKTVKKQIIGNGNASKNDVKIWVKNSWVKLYRKIYKDQDLCDAAMIYTYGAKTVKISEQMNKTAKRIKRTTKPIEAE